MENMTLVRKNEIVQIPVYMIKPNPFQVRGFFDRESVNNLAESIKRYGVLQPICVRRLNRESYEIVFGERRFKACKILKMFYIPCIVSEIGDRDRAVISMIENIQRENIDYFDAADGLYEFMRDYGYSTEKMAEIIGKKEKFVTDKTSILKLKYQFRRDITQNNLSEKYAVALTRIHDDKLLDLILKAVVKFDLSIKTTELLIDLILKRTYIGEKIDEKDIENIILKINSPYRDQKVKVYIDDIKIFTNSVHQIVDTMNKSGIKTECTFNETNDNLEIMIKVDRS